MAIDFPTSPTTGQTVYLAGNAYTWDGTKWWTSTGKSVAVRQTFTAGAGQTTFTVTGGYFAGTIDVYLNGVKLVVGDDVTATDGSTVVLASGATAGDILEVVSFNSFSTANMLPLSGGTVTGNLSVSANTYLATASGNVGIGTSSPGVKLDVSGQRIRINNASDPGIELWNGSVVKGYVFYDTTNDLVTVRHAATGTGMSINSSGRFFVNQTGQLGNTLQRAGIQFAANVEWGLNITNSTTTTGNAINFTNSSGTQIGQIQNTTSATSYVTSSDYRLKENVAPITTGLTTISALKPVTYDWIGDKSQGEGFIAHELQEFIPLAVTGQKDATDADGNPIHQGVDYSKIVVHLVAAIQELKARVEALEAK